METTKTYLPAAAVRMRYGIAKMTIWRWLQNDALAFPKPSRINNRLYWKRADLEAWEASRADGGAHATSAA